MRCSNISSATPDASSAALKLPSTFGTKHFDPFSNLIEVYVNRLRRKIDAPRETPLLHTKRGAGYMLAISEESASSEQSAQQQSRNKSKSPGKKYDV